MIDFSHMVGTSCRRESRNTLGLIEKVEFLKKVMLWDFDDLFGGKSSDILRLDESIEYKLLSGEVVIELFQQFYKNILYSYVIFIDIADL